MKITFLPAGAKRPRTTWAIKFAPGRYLACDKEGEVWRYVGVDDRGRSVEQKEWILAKDAVEKPARMNLHYAELELG